MPCWRGLDKHHSGEGVVLAKPSRQTAHSVILSEGEGPMRFASGVYTLGFHQ